MNIKQGSKKWYDAYVPFVARSVESQIDWLIAAFHKRVLTPQEITPYIRLLLTEDAPEKLDELTGLFKHIDERVLADMLIAADIHEVAKLISLIPHPTKQHASIALGKSPAPYEKTPEILVHKVFQSIYDYSESLLSEAVVLLREQGDMPSHFDAAYARFRETIEDQKLLSSLYPKARGRGV